jgi:hypothetical protein
MERGFNEDHPGLLGNLKEKIPFRQQIASPKCEYKTIYISSKINLLKPSGFFTYHKV